MEKKQKYLEFLNQNETDDESFQKAVVEGQNLLGLSDRQIAREMMITLPTYKRWKEGKNFPHEYMRPGVLNFFKNKIQTQQKEK